VRIFELFEGGFVSEGNDDADHQKTLQKTGFWGKAGAGCLFFARDTKRFLVAHRSAHVEQPNTWGTWGGAIDSGEDPVEAVKREAAEETGYTGHVEIEPLYVFKKDQFRYYNFLVIVDEEFKPHLDWENQGYKWCKWGEWPSPLHFGLVSLLKDSMSAKKMQNLASNSSLSDVKESSDLPETWQVVMLVAGKANVGWQNSKNTSNRTKHKGLSLADGISVLQDPHLKFESQIVNGEPRVKYVGKHSSGAILTCIIEQVHTGEVLPAIRIISVFKATKRDARQYMMQEDNQVKPTEDEDSSPDMDAWPFPSTGTMKPGAPEMKRMFAAHRAAYLAKQKKKDSE